MTDTAPQAGDYDAWAALYDRTLGPDYRDRTAGFLDRALYRHLPPGGRVLDLCCGTGQMMAESLDRGFAVTGLDMSADMLRHAARNAPGATLMQGDARDFTLPQPVHGVLCASASLNHMSSLDDLGRVFRAVHRALEPGGVFVFDINHPAQMTRHWLGRPAAGEIGRDHAWLITPRYDPAAASGAFRVDMYRRPGPQGSSTGPALWRALLSRPLMRRRRLRALGEFAWHHPDWDQRTIDFPVHGHDLSAVTDLLRACGFDARMLTFAGDGPPTEDSAACFACRKPVPATRMEAAE